jgi:nitroimidazol reductase NimA-like FMN-containing flavoprotein (pyridoxamine 5'-phosphate oxidase superfamily)
VTERDRSAPIVDRPIIPREYGVPTTTEGLLDWATVERRLAEARAYWLASVGSDGRPHIRPVDGIYVDDVLYVGGSDEARWVRNLEAAPQVSVHLDGPDVVIVEGEAKLLHGVPKELAERLAAASNAKYPEYGMTAESYAGPGPFAISPRKVIAWTDFARNPTRFRFHP